ncbi:MAG TPA: hypothetical protein VGM88_24870 [Kofleriaceae bacterium]|jgi:hypothetical protein
MLEESAVAMERFVDPLGGADRETLHAFRECASRGGFYDQVEVTRLDREVDDAEGFAIGNSEEGSADRVVEVALAETRDVVTDAEHDVDGVTLVVEWARVVTDVVAVELRATAVGAEAAVLAKDHFGLARHLDWADIIIRV